MGEVPPLTELYQKYRARGFEFFIVYTREAHPGENFPHHVSLEQKVSYAKELKKLDKVEIPVLVDDLEGSTHNAYGALPNMIYLIDRHGVVVYKSDWTDAHELDGMCESLVRLDDMKARQVPIIRTGCHSGSIGFRWIRGTGNGYTGVREKRRSKTTKMPEEVFHMLPTLKRQMRRLRQGK